MARLAVGLSALVLAALVALLWVQRDQLFAPPDDPLPIAIPDQSDLPDLPDQSDLPDLPPESILSAIETLESESDAKCHSSASRFEDFIYGTPLADEGRWANVDLQKRWVHRVWAEASEAASRAGEAAVSPQRLREQIEQWFDWSEAPGGQIEIRFINHPPLTISKLRAEQYGSIAYSLRAILSVQQDRILSSGDDLLTLAPRSIEALRESTDTVTLGALMIADQRAREQNEFEITGATLRSAWGALFPDLEDSVPSGTDPSVAVDEKSRVQLLAMLEEMIAGKVAAHQTYNDLPDHITTVVLLRANIARFYARTPTPKKKQGWMGLISKFNGELDEFTLDLLLEASAHAAGAGHDLIRAVDASHAVQRFIPHEIDDFEDVRVFPRLAPADQITLEAHDCDSFRDFGIHWRPLERAIHTLPKEARLPDPFAAEILAEAISQYGILLLRVAGELAKQNTADIRLRPWSFAPAVAAIAERTKQHHDAPDVPELSSRIVSVEGATAAENRDLFFSDVTTSSGVDYTHRTSNWLNEMRRKKGLTPPTFSGGGVAAEDVDGDSDIDLLFVGGAGNALLLNDGRGTFSDATREAGIEWLRADGSHAEARNPIIADFDNDGRQDILITYANDNNRLYRNVGGARFEDVTRDSGLGGEGLIAGPVVVFDFDSDGLLDVYVGYYGDYLRDEVPLMVGNSQNALPNRLLRNLGGLRFEDVTEGSGTADVGWVQALSHVDFDRDGRQDIIVANDYGRNAFLRNLGDGKFEDAAPSLGIKNAYHSMSIAFADFNHDEFPDIFISNIAVLVKDGKYILPDVDTPMQLKLHEMEGMLIKESNMFYLSDLEQGRLARYVPSKNVERGETSTGWSWGADFLDFDCDGDDDLYIVNGTNDYNTFANIYNYVDSDGQPGQMLLNHTRESNVLFVNDGGILKNESARSGADFAVNSRSSAYLDFDGDGDLDIAVNNFHLPALMFRNNADQRDLRWLKIRLIGDPSRGSNRDAIGARIVVTTNDRLQITREVQGGSGYLSMNPKEQHFGLGRSQLADVRIIWPNGEQQKLENLAANRTYTLRQSENAQKTSRVEHRPNLER